MSNLTLRPRNWDELIGQTAAKRILATAIIAAHNQTQPLDHVLLVGPPGTGKTSLGELIAVELDAPFVETSRPVSSDELVEMLEEHGPGVYFFEEIHRLPKGTAEDLLSLMDGGVMDTRYGRMEFPCVTIIGATTERQGIIKPLLSRFRMRPQWQPYTEEEMTTIVRNLAARIDVSLEDDMVAALARASAGIPRDARSLVLGARDIAANERSITLTEVLAFVQVAEDGLSADHLQYLAVLGAMRQCGLSMLSARLQLHPDVVQDLERLLFDRGLIQMDNRGRRLTGGGRRRLQEVAA